MKFVINENLPPRPATWLGERGHDAVHCRYPPAEDTSDRALAQRAVTEDRVIVTKDGDFDSPRAGERVLHLRIGNCSTAELLEWFDPRLDSALVRFARSEIYVEVT